MRPSQQREVCREFYEILGVGKESVQDEAPKMEKRP